MWLMARSRGDAEYSAAPLASGRRLRRRPWLRTAQLNAVGWAAQVGACIVAAAVGVAAARVVGLPSGAGAVLAVVPLGAVLLADRKRWAAMETGLGWGGSVDAVAAIAAELRAQGVVTHVDIDGPPPEGWDAPVSTRTGNGSVQTASLSYRNRDAAKVRATLRAHGIDLPDLPW